VILQLRARIKTQFLVADVPLPLDLLNWRDVHSLVILLTFATTYQLSPVEVRSRLAKLEPNAPPSHLEANRSKNASANTKSMLMRNPPRHPPATGGQPLTPSHESVSQ
jgi:hypothetical protein